MNEPGRPRNLIDVELARQLYEQFKRWKPAVEEYNRRRGTTWTMLAVYHSVYAAEGRRRREPEVDSNKMLGVFWMPAKAKPLRIIPDYKHNTTRKA